MRTERDSAATCCPLKTFSQYAFFYVSVAPISTVTHRCCVAKWDQGWAPSKSHVLGDRPSAAEPSQGTTSGAGGRTIGTGEGSPHLPSKREARNGRRSLIPVPCAASSPLFSRRLGCRENRNNAGPSAQPRRPENPDRAGANLKPGMPALRQINRDFLAPCVPASGQVDRGPGTIGGGPTHGTSSRRRCGRERAPGRFCTVRLHPVAGHAGSRTHAPRRNACKYSCRWLSSGQQPSITFGGRRRMRHTPGRWRAGQRMEHRHVRISSLSPAGPFRTWEKPTWQRARYRLRRGPQTALLC